MSVAIQGLSVRAPGPCPVCGAADGACRAEGSPEGRTGFLVTRQMNEVMSRGHRSTVQVWENERLKYGVGTPIPLAEAIVQGQVSLSELDEGQRVDVLAHVRADPRLAERLRPAVEQERERRKGIKKPPRDKVVREGQTETKGEEDEGD